MLCRYWGKAGGCLLSVPAASNPPCSKTSVRAGKSQGGLAAPEVSLFYLPTQIKSSIVSLKEGWREIKNLSLKVIVSYTLYHFMSCGGSCGSEYLPPARDRSSFCGWVGWGAGLCWSEAEGREQTWHIWQELMFLTTWSAILNSAAGL